MVKVFTLLVYDWTMDDNPKHTLITSKAAQAIAGSPLDQQLVHLACRNAGPGYESFELALLEHPGTLVLEYDPNQDPPLGIHLSGEEDDDGTPLNARS